MNSLTKIALVSASILSMGALTACQSSSTPKNGPEGRHMMGHHKMSPEQREQFKQMRAERHEFMKQAKSACDNKAVGSSVQIKAGDKTVDGTCAINFRPDRDSMKDIRLQDKHKGMRFKRGQELTAEQKAQIDQKRAERKAKWEAIQSACANQTNGKQIQVKLDDKLINGQCFVHFKPNARPETTPVPATQAPAQKTPAA
ncbi:hypothetical protein [Acinetobacter stercoris]|uniref:LTXXQ motif protein n=1 Tax=Acinetobacter stercoris TaxID=2126983 RepID=A0A2U3N1Z3_9GAMM|nr:hypothetical protein [Acinetobacter stercoris]SPL71653.1 LTXXQ motif protein [Acinetobacter stercoris]